MVKQAATATRTVSETAMFLLVEVAPKTLPLEPEVAEGVDPNRSCIGFEPLVSAEELKPLASCAKPVEVGLARKTEYTLFRNVSPTIQEGTLEPVPTVLPISKIPPAHIGEVAAVLVLDKTMMVPRFMSRGLICQLVLPKDMEIVTLVLKTRSRHVFSLAFIA
jgi:hypothetical protein